MRGNVIPPPRHVLSGEDDDLDENLTTEYSLEVSDDLPRNTTVVLLAARVAHIALDTGKASSDRLVLRSTTKFSELPQVESELYDVQVDEDITKDATYFCPVFVVGKVVVVALPPLDEGHSAFAGNAIVAQLRPSRLLVATPGQVFGGSSGSSGSGVTRISTSASTAEYDVPFAVPPTIVQGTGAAAISAAERAGIDATAFIVQGDGPVNYEISTSQDVAELKRVCLDAAGIESVPSQRQIATDLSTLYV